MLEVLLNFTIARNRKFLSILFMGMTFISCSSSFQETIVPLDGYKIEDGFEIDMIAAEPLLKAPVALSFDERGRIWVAEMSSYMSDIEGKEEDKPIGKIKILEDLDGDGIMDHTKIFLDSLILPRALAHVYGGLLYAEPPFLYFVDIENDTPKNKIIVDSVYAAEGNPEHQPNGLLMNIDNWIYNAKSNFRYRRINNVWIKEPTTFRGQWGIANDNFGRLYYNNNSTQLIGDYVVPNRMIRNEYVSPKFGVNTILTSDQRVYPLQPTLVNRGYSEGVLNADSLLVNVTATCSPLVYRGGMFPLEYEQDVFVCVPEANLIKRNKLTFYGDSTSAKQAYEGKEFLASFDEGFRPVALANGPDGGIYVVDMHRGVIGHHAYLSPYFKKKAKAIQIDTLVNYGRILKIDTQENTETFDSSVFKVENLLTSLNHKNGWIRDKAQQKLIENSSPDQVERLKTLVLNEEISLAQLHALYVLEGTEHLSFEFLYKVAKKKDSKLVAHALALLEDYIVIENTKKATVLFVDLLNRDDTSTNLYLASTLGTWAQLSEEVFFPLVVQLWNKNPNNRVINEALLSGLSGREEALLNYLNGLGEEDSFNFLKEGLAQTIDNKKNDIKNSIYTRVSLNEDNRTKGAKLFRQICAACHGINGEGMNGLAPPLANSEYASEPVERLALIMLHGLTGPVHVNGKLYEFNQSMPGLLANETLTDTDISDIISYVTNGFSDNPIGISAEKIKELRRMKSKSGGEYTEQELLKLF